MAPTWTGPGLFRLNKVNLTLKQFNRPETHDTVNKWHEQNTEVSQTECFECTTLDGARRHQMVQCRLEIVITGLVGSVHLWRRIAAFPACFLQNYNMTASSKLRKDPDYTTRFAAHF